MKTISRITALLPGTIAAALLCGTVAAAPLQNGGFESGTFSPWTVSGVGTVAGTTSGVSPVEGSFQAVLNTPHTGTVFQGTMESFLGLAGGTLSQYNTGGIGGGSAFAQTFDLTAGQVVTFNWNFLPNGSNTTSGQNDTAFFTLHLASDTSSTNVIRLSSTSLSGGAATGYQLFISTPVTTTGTYLLGFGDYDQETPAGAFNAQRPTLFIDNVAVVPEPATISLLGIGALAGGAYLIRRRRS